MGMFTCVKLDGIVKEEYREAIDFLMKMKKGKKRERKSVWVDTGNRFGIYNFKKYSECIRSSDIPFAQCWDCLLPDEDKDPDGKWIRAFNKQSWNKESGQWRFVCILKAYDYEVECFVQLIWNLIIQEGSFEAWYEQDESPYIQLKRISEESSSKKKTGRKPKTRRKAKKK